MEQLDPGLVDSNSAVGQITLLLIALAAILTPLGTLISRWPKKKRNYSTLVDELKRSRREREFQAILIKNFTDWQMTARQLIHLKRSELTANGIKPKKRMIELREALDRIDERDPYAGLSDENDPDGLDESKR